MVVCFVVFLDYNLCCNLVSFPAISILNFALSSMTRFEKKNQETPMHQLVTKITNEIDLWSMCGAKEIARIMS